MDAEIIVPKTRWQKLKTACKWTAPWVAWALFMYAMLG